jgi:hypothetical protein
MLDARVPTDGDSDGSNESCCEGLKCLYMRSVPQVPYENVRIFQYSSGQSGT